MSLSMVDLSLFPFVLQHLRRMETCIHLNKVAKWTTVASAPDATVSGSPLAISASDPSLLHPQRLYGLDPACSQSRRHAGEQRCQHKTADHDSKNCRIHRARSV